MKANTNKVAPLWVIYFVGFDEAGVENADQLEPHVGFERIETSVDNQQQRHDDAYLAALVRGGQLLAVVDDDDRAKVAELAAALEKEILRMR